MKRILFYISGHGYGHATRSIEVAKALLERQPDLEIVFETDAAPWLFPLNLQRGYQLISRQTDIGVVQRDSYSADKLATLQAFAEFYRSLNQRLPEELELVRKNRIQLIIGDIPPLAFWVAEEAGLPSLAITNFSWDWIYSPYAGEFPEYRWIIDVIRQAYGSCDLLLELPFAGDLSAFPRRKPIPVIARHARRSPEEIRSVLGIAPHIPFVLVALRQADLERVNLSPLKALREFRFLFFAPVPQSDNFISVAPDAFVFPDLLRAADVVVSKPGYGIVSECLANRTPMLFAPRKDFAEYGVLERHLLETRTGYRLESEKFFAGEWHNGLQALLTAKISWPNIATNGAEVAAGEIQKMLQKI
ncbi:MAG TPA: hypothetical protein ENJ23_02970 [Bacteroidetes bacterium]|nr:hypothetical protein [Bacteroidota bacterium]